jgi:hypothetical protein
MYIFTISSYFIYFILFIYIIPQNYETEVRSRGTAIHKDLEALFGNLRRSDTVVMDTVPAPLTKIPSLTKPPSIKVLKPSSTISLKGTRKPRTTCFKAKHTKMMEKRNEQLLEKYKVRIGY